MNNLLQGSRQGVDAQAGATQNYKQLQEAMRNEYRSGINLDQQRYNFEQGGRGKKYLGTDNLDKFFDQTDRNLENVSFDQAKQNLASSKQQVDSGIEKARADLAKLQPHLSKDYMGRFTNPYAAEEAARINQVISSLEQVGTNLNSGQNRFQEQKES